MQCLHLGSELIDYGSSPVVRAEQVQLLSSRVI